MNLLHSVQVQNQTPGADAILTHDLAVNPLSVVLLRLSCLNDTGTIANFVSLIELIDALNRVNILWRGQSIVSGTGRDLLALAALRHGAVPWMANHALTDNHRITAVLPIFMGKRAYDPQSCFPASRAGELQIELDVDIADTGYDGFQYGVETIEIIGADPQEFERKVTLSRTHGATGVNVNDLPVGNLVRGCLLFGTTGYAGAAPVPSWGRVKFVGDGVEMGIAGSDWEVQHSLPGMLGIPVPRYDNHIHGTDGTILPSAIGGGGWQNYAFMNLDPWGNDVFAIDTAKLSRFQISVDVETADAVRWLPIERVKV